MTRKRRSIYYNDARHYYLFVFEPPMALEDAWVPIDEVAGTNIDTFIYGVARGDGVFYPSKVDHQFGSEMVGQFRQNAYWRTWYNMKSLEERGLDPLSVLIDRAHEKGMEFFASLRMGNYFDMDDAHRMENGGGMLAHEKVRDHNFRVLEELVTAYNVEGVEVDLALGGGGPRLMRELDVAEMTPVMTEYMREISQMVRGRPGTPGEIGVRVLPTEQMNLDQGLDVRAWLQDGLVDWIVPVRYGYQLLDPNVPFDWLIEACHEADVSFYGMLLPYVGHQSVGESERQWPTAEQARAAIANYWSKEVDGIYAWFMKWPLGDTESRILSEIGEPELVKERDKHYVLARSVGHDQPSHYHPPLPFTIKADDTGTPHAIPFYICDDIDGLSHRIRQVRLKIRINDLTSFDRLTIFLNGASLADEFCIRDYHSHIAAYHGQWLEFALVDVRPRQGDNVLEITLDARPDGLISPLVVEKLEVIVEYGSYPSRL